MTGPLRIWVGRDAREIRAWNVACASFRRYATQPLELHAISMSSCPGLYTRPTRILHTGGYWDEISEAPMSTSHAIARFLVPFLCGYQGWALFTDGDVLCRTDVAQLFALADERYAVQVVHHQYAPVSAEKMDGQVQTRYPRKNWSSVMLFNCGHPLNKALTVDHVNAVPGRDLHRFDWLPDEWVGPLPESWNWLAGHSSPTITPDLVHFTEGVPDMPGYEHGPYTDEWYEFAQSCGYRLPRPALEISA